MVSPVCLIHNQPASANPPHWAGKCMFCCLCFKVLNNLEEMNLLPNGKREDVCYECASGEKVNPVESAAWFECGWGEAYHRLAGLLWDRKPPQEYLDKVAYLWERRNRAAKREDEIRIAAGLDPLWNTKR